MLESIVSQQIRLRRHNGRFALRRALLCAAVAAAAFLVGCGGGGRPSSSSASASSPARQVQSGNAIVYSVTGTADGPDPVPVTGTATLTVRSDPQAPKYGGRVLYFHYVFDLTWEGVGTEMGDWGYMREQTPDGTMYDANSEILGIAPSTALPVVDFCPTSQGQSSSYTLTLAEGTDSVTVTAGAAQQIAGITAYEIDATDSYQPGSLETLSEWFAPSLGLPAKVMIPNYIIGPQLLSITLTYQSKNF